MAVPISKSSLPVIWSIIFDFKYFKQKKKNIWTLCSHRLVTNYRKKLTEFVATKSYTSWMDQWVWKGCESCVVAFKASISLSWVEHMGDFGASRSTTGSSPTIKRRENVSLDQTELNIDSYILGNIVTSTDISKFKSLYRALHLLYYWFSEFKCGWWTKSDRSVSIWILNPHAVEQEQRWKWKFVSGSV